MAGRKEVFKGIEIEWFRVQRKVPKGTTKELKKELNEKIKELQKASLDKCVEEALKNQ